MIHESATIINWRDIVQQADDDGISCMYSICIYKRLYDCYDVYVCMYVCMNDCIYLEI